MTGGVLIRDRVPSPTVGADGIPDYITAIHGDPRAWHPEPGQRLHVYCDGHRLRYVIEADRVKGWAVCKKMLETPTGFREVPGKQILYRGVIEYEVMADE